MKKVFRMKNLDCASCAAKMEKAIKKISGVTDAKINFFMQTLTLSAEDQQYDSIVSQVQASCKRIEPDCIIVL